MTVTNDSYMMMEIIERNYTIIKQAYNFKYLGSGEEVSIDIRKAELSDVPMMKDLFKDFFDDYEEKIKTDNLYLGPIKVT